MRESPVLLQYSSAVLANTAKSGMGIPCSEPSVELPLEPPSVGVSGLGGFAGRHGGRARTGGGCNRKGEGQRPKPKTSFGAVRAAKHNVIMALLCCLVLAAGCTSSESGGQEPSSTLVLPDEDVVAESATTSSSTSPSSPPSGAASSDTEPEVTEANAIEALLVSYVEAINDRRGTDAYAMFTDALRERVDLDDLIEGTSTSVISRLSVSKVEFDADRSAVAYANFRTDQASEFGREGQTCSLWELEYQMVNLDGGWLIDRATPLSGSPFACPVVGIDADTGDDEPVVREPGERIVVHLTLDDGPGPETERFLDLFDEFGVKATFFVNSNRIAGRESIVQRIVAEGHAVANHTHTHCNLQNPDRLTPSELCAGRTATDEIADAQRIIEASTGVVPTCFRPPYGAQSAATKDVIAQFGLRNWLWDIDTNDWKFNARNADYSDRQALAELDKVATRRPAYGSEGVIVLLHDGTASAPRMLGLLRTWLEGNGAEYDFLSLDGC